MDEEDFKERILDDIKTCSDCESHSLDYTIGIPTRNYCAVHKVLWSGNSGEHFCDWYN